MSAHRNHPPTEEELRTIAEMNAKGATIAAIVRHTGISKPTIRKWLAKMGLPSRVPLIELHKEEILELVRERKLSHKQIAKNLRVPVRQLAKFAQANGFAKPRRPLSEAQIDGICADILARRGTGEAIANRWNAPHCKVLEMAHALLGREPFLLGKRDSPLQSNFPQRFPRKVLDVAKPDTFVVSLQAVIEKCYDGKLPPPQDEKEFLARFTQDIPAHMPEVAAETAAGFKRALQTLRVQRSARWAN